MAIAMLACARALSVGTGPGARRTRRGVRCRLASYFRNGATRVVSGASPTDNLGAFSVRISGHMPTFFHLPVACWRCILVLACSSLAGTDDALADKKTVCTITVNSADEKEAFRRTCRRTSIGSSSWSSAAGPTGSSRRAARASAATCWSSPATTTAATSSSPNSVEAREFLPVDEMERVSCSDSCPGLFSQLKEVYLFGCNTLNPGGATQRLRRGRAQPRARGHLARPTPSGSRARSTRATARAAATGCGSCSRTCRRSTASRRSRRSGRRPASILQPLLPGGRRERGRHRPRERPAARRSSRRTR